MIFNSSIDPEVPIRVAQYLAILAEHETDPITQEIIYLDSILCSIDCRHLMENNGSRENLVLNIYNDTFDSIK